MTATAKPTKFLSARILIPAVSALALSWGAPLAKADIASDQAAIKAQLDQFAKEVAAPGKAPAATSLLTAKADDLVLAVYQVIANGGANYDDPTEIANLVASALSAAPDTKGVLKVRADKDKIVARLVDAAVNGLDFTAAIHTAPKTTTSAATVSEILTKVLAVNPTNTKFQLTAAGKASAVTQALKDVANATDGTAIATAAISTNAPLKDLQAFTIATLKTIGTDTGRVKSFVEQILNTATSLPDGAAKDAFALNVAAALSANPNAVGEVIGAAAKLKADADIPGFLTATGKTAILANPKFAKAIPNIVASVFQEVDGDRTNFAKNLIAAQTKVATKGLVAAGLLHSAAAGETTNSIIGDAVAALATAKATDKVAFAAAAATGNGNSSRAAEVATEVANTVSDAATKTLIGAAIVKSIAATGPEGAQAVATALLNSTGNAFSDATAKTNLAVALAKAVPTNATAAGAAVAGVASTLATDADRAAISAAAIKVASKATTGITSEVAALVADKKQFAINLANASTPAVAGAIAAGAALADLDNTGAIAVAVAKASDKITPQTLKIAQTVAAAVDVEHVADVGQRVTAMIADGTVAKAPKTSTLPALASSLAKLIQSKPNVLFSNRVDELSELAAAMVAQVVTKTQDQKLLGAIGSSIIKALSTKLLPNSSGRQADFRDAVGSIAGSIAQAISYKLAATLSGTALQTAFDQLLGSNSALLKALQTAATKGYAADVTAAFGEVHSLAPGAIVPGDKLIGEDSIKVQNATLHGKYEIGSVIDEETPIKNI